MELNPETSYAEEEALRGVQRDRDAVGVPWFTYGFPIALAVKKPFAPTATAHEKHDSHRGKRNTE